MSASNLWEINSAATAANKNGGAFNTANANFLTDFAATSATGDSPVITSATYTFVAGDVGAWIYVKSGTNWVAGFYKIASVAAGAATVNATIGAAVRFDSTTNSWKPSTTAGCATVASPTSGTCGVDYSQGTAAILTKTDLTCTAASTTITSALSGFTPVMVGNIVHLTALTGTGALPDWYEIVTYTDAHNVVLDRTPTNGVNNITAGTFYVGGAMSLGSTLDDNLFEAMVDGNHVFLTGACSLGETVSLGWSAATLSFMVEGYQTIRGDNPTGANRPSIANGTYTFGPGPYHNVKNIKLTGTGTFVISITSSFRSNCKAVNTSATADYNAFLLASTNVFLSDCEGQSYNGAAFSSVAQGGMYFACWAHDSANGFLATTNFINAKFCHATNIGVAAGNDGAGFETTTGLLILINCDATNCYMGINSTSGLPRLINNIISDCVIGANYTTQQNASIINYNNFYGNTTDRTNVLAGLHDSAYDPAFQGRKTWTDLSCNNSTTVTSVVGGFLNLAVGQKIHITTATGGWTAGWYRIVTLTDDNTIVVDTQPATGTPSTGGAAVMIDDDARLGTNSSCRGAGTELTLGVS